MNNMNEIPDSTEKNREAIYNEEDTELLKAYTEHCDNRSKVSKTTVTIDEKSGSRHISKEDENDLFLMSARMWDALGRIDVGTAAYLSMQAQSASTTSPTGVAIDSSQMLMAGIGPQDATEAMLATQMVATHNSAMYLLKKMHGAELLNQFNSYSNQANKLLRTFTTQTEALKRHRQKASQTVRVERVYVNEGGQAIVGDVHHTGGGGTAKTKEQAHALGYAPGTEMRCEDTKRNAVPVASDEERAL